MTQSFQIERLGPGDEHRLNTLADGVFDNDIKPHLARRFLEGPHNVLVVACNAEIVVGMGSGLIYLHPDKEPEMFVNEIGVASPFRRMGIARNIMLKLQSIAAGEGCVGCWLLTDSENAPANALYQSLDGWRGPADQVMYDLPTVPS